MLVCTVYVSNSSSILVNYSLKNASKVALKK